MKIKARQFKTEEEIEIFLAEKEDGTLDNIWENLVDEFEEEADLVREFNKSLNSLAELIS